MVFTDLITRIIRDQKKEPSEYDDSDMLTLFSWGSVHGITILLVRKNFPYEGDVPELVRKLIWSKSVIPQPVLRK